MSPEASVRLLIFVTDGVPTFPFGKGAVSDEEDLKEALKAAREAREGGIIIDSYVLGSGALRFPLAPTKIASVTNGVYTPVVNPDSVVPISFTRSAGSQRLP